MAPNEKILFISQRPTFLRAATAQSPPISLGFHVKPNVNAVFTAQVPQPQQRPRQQRPLLLLAKPGF
jgi:hypothetical protein